MQTNHRLILALLCLATAGCRPPDPAPALLQPDGIRVREITAAELARWNSTHRQYALIDVREDNEWSAGHAAGALHIPRWTLAERLPGLLPDRNHTIVLYCLGGVRSAAGAATLERLGYHNVFSLAGGIRNYQAAGLPMN